MTSQPHVQKFTVPDSAHGLKFTDTIEIDQDAHVLYAVDNWSAGVDVFDIATDVPRYVKTVPVRGSLYGLALAPDLQRLYVGMAASAVTVIDLDPASATVHTVIARVETEGRGAADLLDYDPVHHKVYVANRHLVDGVDNGFLTAIDAMTNKVVGRIDGLGRTLEQPRYNPADGMVYVTCAGDNLLHQVDPVTDKLTNTWDVGDDCHPNGLAINPDTNEALLACNNRTRPHTVIWDLGRQEIASVIEESGAGDGAIYDATIDRFFFAASNHSSGPVMGIFGGHPARWIANVPTAVGASWVAYDRAHRLVYAPTFEGGKPGLLSFPLPEA